MTDVQTIAKNALEKAGDVNPAKQGSPLSGAKGIAAGAALVALPVVVERVAKLAGPKVSDKASELGDKATGKVKEAAQEKAGELTPDMPKGLSKLFGGGGDDADGAGEGSAAPGFGSGRRMPVQQSIDVAVPVRVAYNAWTQFENWPKFMHRLESVEQIDDCTVAFEAKVWGINRRFEAQIIGQRPDERIEWDVSQGLAHTGVVTFHKLSDRLTRIEVTVDFEPSGMLEKMGRGMRFIKRAVRGDLHRFKAFVELEEEAEGAWRGTIKNGKVTRRTDRGSSSNGRSRSGGSGSRRKAGSRS